MKKSRIVAVIVLTGIVLADICLVVWRMTQSPATPIAQSLEQQWRSGSDRHLIARELIADGRLLKLSESNLVQLLGKPDEVNDPDSRWSMGWFLRMRDEASLLFPVEEYLVVKIRNGSVERAFLVNYD